MKKIKFNPAQTFLAGLCVGALAVNGSAVANTVSQWIEVSYIGLSLYIDGTETTVKDSNGQDTEPFVYQGTTYVPLAFVSSSLGQQVTWDGANNSIYIGAVPELPSPTPQAPTIDYEGLYHDCMLEINLAINAFEITGDYMDTDALSLPHYFNYTMEGIDLGYDLVDVNGDNIPELFLLSRSNQTIYSCFTIQNGAVVNVLVDGERWGYRLTEDKVFLEWGSGGAADSIEALGKLNAQGDYEYTLYLNTTLEDSYDWNSNVYTYYIPLVQGQPDFDNRRVASEAEELLYQAAAHVPSYVFDAKFTPAIQ